MMPDWARLHLLELLGLMIGAIGVGVPVALWWLQRRHARRDVAEQRLRGRDRTLMLRRVRSRWITGVLDQSLDKETRLRLGLARRLDAAPQSEMLRRRSSHEAQPLPAGAEVRTVFDQVGGGLLLLGPPGSGKTTALLELARDLLDKAEADPTQPMPVIFNLSSWAMRRPPLPEWLIAELHDHYDVPRALARQWVGEGEILPLLDGLDEVARTYRSDCVGAINAFSGTRGLMRFVVCSRTRDYNALATRLRVEEAVELQAPTRQQVRDYLQGAGGALADVQAAIAADPSLWELLQSPLALSIVALTYEDRPVDTLQVPGTPGQRLERLFAAYAERMLARHHGRYRPDRMVHWLTWLARAMRRRNQSEFHLDRLQPGWLPTPGQQRLATLGPAISVGLIAGLLDGVAYGLIRGPVWGLLNGAAYGLFFGLFAGLRSTEPVKEVRWSWRRMGYGLRRGLIIGLIIGPAVGLVAGPVLGLINALIWTLGFGTFFGLFAGLRRT
ncbi:MAG: NACHT domain-containing protein, partial [Actinomycetota bacterium]